MTLVITTVVATSADVISRLVLGPESRVTGGAELAEVVLEDEPVVPLVEVVVEMVELVVGELVVEVEAELVVGELVVEVEVEVMGELVVGELVVGELLGGQKDAVVAAVLVVAVKLVLKISRVDLAVSTTVDVPATVVISLVSTVEVLSRQPTLPFRSVGIESGWFLPPTTLTTLQTSVEPPLQFLRDQLSLQGTGVDGVYQNRSVSPAGASCGMVNSATWGPKQLMRSKMKVTGGKFRVSDPSVASQAKPSGLSILQES
jgi:hypothetical protein